MRRLRGQSDIDSERHPRRVADLKWLGGIHWHRALAKLKIVIQQYLKENE
jgi:hypothetical protein